MTAEPPAAEPPVFGPQEAETPPVPALGPVPMEPVPPPERRGRAGRDLVAAISVGVALAAVVVTSLSLRPIVFVAVVVAAAVLGVLELANAIATTGTRVPLLPVLATTTLMPFMTYAGGAEALFLTLAASVFALWLWRLPFRSRATMPSQTEDFGGVEPAPIADAAAGVFAILYVPFLASFAVLLVLPDDGRARVLVFVLLTVLSDIGGYAAGVLFGRHAMSPSISPKKSWEGSAGSLLFSAGGGALIINALTWGSAWQGALIGLALMLTATLGDLGESMIKRDIGVKDMGSLLPGHGGLMDRLDSLLPAAPIAFLLLSWVAPT